MKCKFETILSKLVVAKKKKCTVNTSEIVCEDGDIMEQITSIIMEGGHCSISFVDKAGGQSITVMGLPGKGVTSSKGITLDMGVNINPDHALFLADMIMSEATLEVTLDMASLLGE